MLILIQATHLNAANRIAKNGFGTTAALDSGYYGQGIYLTSKIDYCRFFSDRYYHQEGAYLVSVVIPGNCFPVIEKPNLDDPKSFFGKPCRPGYQSHYVLVSPGGLPLKEHEIQEDSFDELVLFESSQVLPLMLIKSSNPSLSRGRSPLRFEPPNQGFLLLIFFSMMTVLKITIIITKVIINQHLLNWRQKTKCASLFFSFVLFLPLFFPFERAKDSQKQKIKTKTENRKQKTENRKQNRKT